MVLWLQVGRYHSYHPQHIHMKWGEARCGGVSRRKKEWGAEHTKTNKKYTVPYYMFPVFKKLNILSSSYIEIDNYSRIQ